MEKSQWLFLQGTWAIQTSGLACKGVSSLRHVTLSALLCSPITVCLLFFWQNAYSVQSCVELITICGFFTEWSFSHLSGSHVRLLLVLLFLQNKSLLNQLLSKVAKVELQSLNLISSKSVQTDHMGYLQVTLLSLENLPEAFSLPPVGCDTLWIGWRGECGTRRESDRW